MVRVVDLSQAVEASPGPAPYHAPPHYNHHEYLDDNFHRSELMGLVDVDRLDLGDDGQPCLEVTMSVDPMGRRLPRVSWILSGGPPPDTALGVGVGCPPKTHQERGPP